MRVIPDWRKVARYAWSVKLILIAGLLSGIEAALPILSAYFGLRTFAAITFFIVMLALIARFVAQEKISGGLE